MNILDDQFPIFRKPGWNSRPVTYSVPLMIPVLLVLKAKAEVTLVVASKQASRGVFHHACARRVPPGPHPLYSAYTCLLRKGEDGGDEDDDEEEEGEEVDGVELLQEVGLTANLSLTLGTKTLTTHATLLSP